MIYNIIESNKQLDNFIDLLGNQEEFAFDIESNTLKTHNHDARLVGISFSYKEGQATYIPFNYPSDHSTFTYTYDQIIDKIKTPLESEYIKKIGHNMKYDCRILNRFGINVQNIYFDTMVAAYCIYGDRIKLSLDDLTLHHFNFIKVRTKSVIPKKTKANPNPSMLDTPIDKVGMYGAEDVDYTYRLYKVLKVLLSQEEFSYANNIFYNIDMPLVPVLTRMECNGVKVDESRLGTIRDDLSKDLEDIQLGVNEVANREVVLTNPSDVGSLLFEEKKVHENLNKEIPITESGRKATNKEILKEFASDELVHMVLDYRGLIKLISTYVIALPEYVSKHTDLIHPFFSQTRTSTGRLACSEPNLQNIPARSKTGKKIRSAFVSRWKGGQILAVDYSQAELRILAHASGEPVFVNAYRNDEDIHRAVASEVVFDVPKEQVSDQQRTTIKTINFGLMYGMRAKKLANTLGIPQERATAIMDKYMGKMEGLKNFLDGARSSARLLGYTETLFGRRRYVTKIFSDEQLLQWSAEREAANHIIQGTNADIIKLAMIQCDDMLSSGNFKSKMLLQVHDELVFDVHPDELSFMKDKIVHIMQNIVQFSVVMKAEGKYADSWSEAH